MAETRKAYERRVREGFFEKYVRDPGIDIGCQHDPLNDSFRKWDVIFGDGDATLMEGVPDESFLTVYASHVLEHLDDPILALRNWYRILKPGGFLLLAIPHRDLYEKRTELPSRWNGEHKHFWLPDRYESPCTWSLLHVIKEAIPGALIECLKVCDEDWVSNGPEQHSGGEYSIEAIIHKLPVQS